MFCMNCGTKLPNGAKFCINCGCKLGTVSMNVGNVTSTQKVVPQSVGRNTYQVGKSVVQEAKKKEENIFAKESNAILWDIAEKYKNGSNGTEQDFEKAKEAYQELIRRGVGLAKFELERLNEVGAKKKEWVQNKSSSVSYSQKKASVQNVRHGSALNVSKKELVVVNKENGIVKLYNGNKDFALTKLCANTNKFYKRGSMKTEALQNAIATYAGALGVRDYDVELLYDDTLFSKTGTKGFVVTRDAIVTSRKKKTTFDSLMSVIVDGSCIRVEYTNATEDDIYTLDVASDEEKSYFDSYLNAVHNLVLLQ